MLYDDAWRSWKNIRLNPWKSPSKLSDVPWHRYTRLGSLVMKMVYGFYLFIDKQKRTQGEFLIVYNFVNWMKILTIRVFTPWDISYEKSEKTEKEIIFNHIELEEPVSPEFVKEINELVGKWLFEAWCKWRASGGQATCSASAKPLTDNEFRELWWE